MKTLKEYQDFSEKVHKFEKSVKEFEESVKEFQKSLVQEKEFTGYNQTNPNTFNENLRRLFKSDEMNKLLKGY